MKKIINAVFALTALYLLNPRGGTIFYIKEVRWLYVLLLSFLLTYVLTQAAEKGGTMFNILDYPNERKVHSFPVPVTGGIAVFAGFFFTLVRNLNFSPEAKGVLLAALIMFIVGVLDDMYEIPATVKLFFQFAATTVLIAFGIKVKVVPYSVPFKDVLDIVITYLGVMGITNAFNYMDGMDGEASGLAIITGLTLFAIALANGARNISWLAIALVGCCLGFIFHNFPKAKVFLGDSGSTVIGFLLAAIAIAGSWSAVNAYVAIATPLLIFSIYIFDMIYTTVSRIRNGSVTNLKEWFEVTAKDHFHHRLTNIGFSKAQSVMIIWGSAAIFSFSAFVIRTASWVNALLIMLQCLFIYFLIVVLMLAGRQKT